MSSSPFRAGVPVLDRIPMQTGRWIIRAATREQFARMIRRAADMLTEDLTIYVFEIGYRPDRPVPVSRYFADVIISDTGYCPPGYRATAGRRKALMIYDDFGG